MADRSAGRRLLLFAAAVLGTAAIAAAPRPDGLALEGQYALATLFFAAFLWVTAALPLAVTALAIPVVLTVLGVHADMEPALAGFADPLIFLFLAGFMLASALQKYRIDRRIALRLMALMGTSPRLLVLAAEGRLDPAGRRVAWIFAVIAGLWVLGGLDFLTAGILP
ncbi:MAG: SLC13 family permease [Thiohalorhabdus sp.]